MLHQNYTTYLQKELDFLKLLITRFHEQEKISGLELDIAMQKAQDVYEQLLRIKLMYRSAANEQKSTHHKSADHVVPVAEAELEVVRPQPAVQPKAEKQPESVITPPPAPPAKDPEPIATPKEPIIQEETIVPEPEPIPVKVEKINPVKATPEPAKPTPEPSKTGILAEKISPSEHRHINETLAQQKAGSDLSNKWQTAPLSSIASGIGLNDKFLYIRELFKSDNTLYNNTIQQLDTAVSLSDALDFIQRHFDWDKKDDTTQKFISLVHRRHGN